MVHWFVKPLCGWWCVCACTSSSVVCRVKERCWSAMRASYTDQGGQAGSSTVRGSGVGGREDELLVAVASGEAEDGGGARAEGQKRRRGRV